MSSITTYTGLRFDPVFPDPEKIEIRDIAHALSLTCRGNGHVQHFYSVAQHCIACAEEAIARGYDRRIALICLLHDASEAYMSDVPRPFKAYLAEYLKLEEKLLEMIYFRFLGSEASPEELRILKQIDDDMLWYDLKLLLNTSPEGEEPVMYGSHNRDPVAFDTVEKRYIELFEQLSE